MVRETTKQCQEKLQTILLPLDGSATAEQALPEAQALALANNAQLLLVQMIQKLDEGYQLLVHTME